MIDERVFLQIPIEYEKEVKIYPPTVKQVLSEQYFHFFKRILMMSQEDIEDDINKKAEKEGIKIDSNFKYPTPFEFLFSSISKDKKIELLAKDAFKFFIHEDVTFLMEQKIIVIGDLKEKLATIKNIEELPILNEDNYFNFQNLLRISIGEKQCEIPNPNEHPKVKLMKAKARERDRVKAKKNGIPFSTTLVSICCMGIGITPLNIGEISYACIPVIMNTYQAKEKYEIDLKSMLAGAKDVQLKYWIRDLDKD